MKEICKNCVKCKPTYKGGICEKTGKKTNVRDRLSVLLIMSIYPTRTAIAKLAANAHFAGSFVNGNNRRFQKNKLSKNQSDHCGSNGFAAVKL